MSIHIVLDCETTGLLKNPLAPLADQPAVYEFFALILERDDETGEWHELDNIHALMNPGKHIPQPGDIENGRALTMKNAPGAITGFTDEMVAHNPFFADWFEAIEYEIRYADVVIAHNANYDISVLNYEAERIGKTFEWPSKIVCTVEATTHFHGARMRLGDLYYFLFNEVLEKAHSAEADVRATARCYRELIKRGVISV